jgi:hypothetical protein
VTTVTYLLETEDYVQFNLHVLERVLREKRYRQRYVKSMGVTAIALTLFIVYLHHDLPHWYGPVLFWVPIYVGSAMLLCWALYGGLRVSRRHNVTASVRRIYGAPSPNDSLARTVHMTIAETGVDTTSPLSSSHLAWQAFTSIEPTAHAVYLFTSAAHALIVPNRAFASVEAAARFVELARGYRAQAPAVELPPESPGSGPGESRVATPTEATPRGLLDELVRWGCGLAGLALVLTQLALGWSIPVALGLEAIRYLCIMPLAFALYQLTRQRSSRWSAAVLGIGIASCLHWVLFDGLQAFERLSYVADQGGVHLATLGFAAWMLLASDLTLRAGVGPRVLGRLGVLGGVALAIMAVIELVDGSAIAHGFQPASSDWGLQLRIVWAMLNLLAGAALVGWLFLWMRAIGGLRSDSGERRRLDWRLAAAPLAAVLVTAPAFMQAPPALPGFDPTPYAGTFDDYDCRDFTSQAQAQAVLRANPRDPNQLEAREMGIACWANPGPFDFVRVATRDANAHEPVYRNLVGHGVVYLVPIGHFLPWELVDLRDYYAERYGITVEVLPPLLLVPTGQSEPDIVHYEDIVAALQQTYPEASDPQAMVIAFTAHPMRVHGTGLQIPNEYHDPARRVGLVSVNGAVTPPNFNVNPDWDLLELRIRKYTTRLIGEMYFRIPQNSDPQSLFYDALTGMPELDRVDEDIRTS